MLPERPRMTYNPSAFGGRNGPISTAPDAAMAAPAEPWPQGAGYQILTREVPEVRALTGPAG